MDVKLLEELKFPWLQFKIYWSEKSTRPYSIFTFYSCHQNLKSVTNTFVTKIPIEYWKSYTVGSKPPERPGHSLFRMHFAEQLEKMVHDDPSVLTRIHMTDEVYFRMDRGSTRQKSYELHVSMKPYKDRANFGASGTSYSFIHETCDLF